MATSYYAEHVHVAQTQTQILTLYLCIGQESETESVPESVSGYAIEPLGYLYFWPFSGVLKKWPYKAGSNVWAPTSERTVGCCFCWLMYHSCSTWLPLVTAVRQQPLDGDLTKSKQSNIRLGFKHNIHGCHWCHRSERAAVQAAFFVEFFTENPKKLTTIFSALSSFINTCSIILTVNKEWPPKRVTLDSKTVVVLSIGTSSCCDANHYLDFWHALNAFNIITFCALHIVRWSFTSRTCMEMVMLTWPTWVTTIKIPIKYTSHVFCLFCNYRCLICVPTRVQR